MRSEIKKPKSSRSLLTHVNSGVRQILPQMIHDPKVSLAKGNTFNHLYWDNILKITILHLTTVFIVILSLNMGSHKELVLHVLNENEYKSQRE